MCAETDCKLALILLRTFLSKRLKYFTSQSTVPVDNLKFLYCHYLLPEHKSMVLGNCNLGTRQLHLRYQAIAPYVLGNCTLGTRQLHLRYQTIAPKVLGNCTFGTRQLHLRQPAIAP